MYEEKYRPFVVGAIVGCILWTISGGFIHAYVINPDWKVMGQSTITTLLGWQSFIALIAAGFVFGLSVEVAKFIGVVFRSEGAILFLPIVAGITIGTLQGILVTSNLWGFPPDTVFRDEHIRILTGSIVGLILSYPTIIVGLSIRRNGTPW